MVEGAVDMVEMALDMMASGKLADLDTDRRAALVSNLMVVLCSERDTQPIVNTGRGRGRTAVLTTLHFSASRQVWLVPLTSRPRGRERGTRY